MADLLAMMQPTSPTTRESATSQSKYNRWVSGQYNREAASVLRAQAEAMRQARAEEKEKHRALASARKQERRDLMAKQKALKEQRVRDALEAGAEVKKKAAALKAVKAHMDMEHMERGRAAADRDEEQRRKIRQVKGAAFKNVAEMSALAKQVRAPRCPPPFAPSSHAVHGSVGCPGSSMPSPWMLHAALSYHQCLLRCEPRPG